MSVPGGRQVVHIISGLAEGGAEAVLYRLCCAATAERHHVVSLMDGGTYGPLLAARGIAVTCLGMRRGRLSAVGLWRLWRLLRRLAPDVVQTWMYHGDLVGGVLGRLAGCGNICWGVHHSDLDPAGSRARTIWVARACAVLSGLVPRRIICCAEAARRSHAGLGYAPARLRVVLNGYDLALFRPDPGAGAALRAALGIAPEAMVIGCVARIEPQKDHDTLLAALAQLKAQGAAPLCLLVGTVPAALRPGLEARIAALGLGAEVRLLGPRRDIPAVMAALDLHVLASAFGEAFPNVLAEAMASGTPCVATAVGDAAAILGGTGLVVPPRQPLALAAAILTLLAERQGPAWPERQSAARRHIAERFAIERMVEGYRDVWFDQSASAQREGRAAAKSDDRRPG